MTSFEFTNISADIKAKRWQKAAESLESVLISEPNNLTAKNLLGLCYNNWGVEHMHRGNSLMQNKDLDKAKEAYQQAEELFKKAVKQEPINITYKANLSFVGQILHTGFEFSDIHANMKNKEWDKTTKKLKAILKNDPEKANARTLLALCYNNWAVEYMNNGNQFIRSKNLTKAKNAYKVAIKLLQKAIKEDSTNPTYKANLSQVQNSLQTDPDFVEIYEDMNMKQWEKALDKLEPFLQKKRQNDKAKELFLICCDNWARVEFEKNQNLDKAISILERGLKYMPNDKILKQGIENLNRGLALKLNAEGVALINQAVEQLKKRKYSIAQESLMSAESVLQNAVNKDSTNAVIKGNLTQVKQGLQNLVLRKQEYTKRKKNILLNWISIILAIHGSYVVISLYQESTLVPIHYIIGLLTIPFGIISSLIIGVIYILSHVEDISPIVEGLTELSQDRDSRFIIRILLLIVMAIAIITTIIFWFKCFMMLAH